MKTSSFPLLLGSLSLFFFADVTPTDARGWVDSTGRKVEAEMVRVNGDNVVLKLSNGRELPYPIAKLSDDDQKFIKSEQAKAPSGLAATPAEEPEFKMPDVNNMPKPEAWPKSVSVDVTQDVEELPESKEGAWVYETKNFRFYSNAKLGKNVITEFSRLFEVVHAAIDQAPYPLLREESKGKKHVVRLFESSAQYMKAGGLPGSAGVFIGRTKEVLVPLDSLGVKRVGSRFSIESRDENQTLIHEIVHQLTWHWPLGQWWAEGLADFISGAGYGPGRLHFSSHARSLREYLKERKGVWDEDYTAVHPADLLVITNAQWNKMLAGKNNVGIKNYASSAMLMYFFMHLDGDGDGSPMLAYMHAVRAGMGKDEAAKTFLLRGRTTDELAKDMAKGWRRYSLKLQFHPPTLSASE